MTAPTDEIPGEAGLLQRATALEPNLRYLGRRKHCSSTREKSSNDFVQQMKA